MCKKKQFGNNEKVPVLQKKKNGKHRNSRNEGEKVHKMKLNNSIISIGMAINILCYCF